MPDEKPKPIITALSAVVDKIADWIERIINWLVNTRFIKWLALRAEWIRRFLRIAHLVRFSFWISVLGSVALFATSQSAEILRVIAEAPTPAEATALCDQAIATVKKAVEP